MYLYAVIVVLVLVIIGMAWVLFSKSKEQKKYVGKNLETLKETFDTTHHAIIDEAMSCNEMYDSYTVLLEQIQTLNEQNIAYEEEINILQMKEKKMSVGLAQKSHEIIHISHQMRTSLSGLLGFTEFLKSTDLNEEQQEFVSIIGTSSNELLTLVNGIIDMTPKESNSTRQNTPISKHISTKNKVPDLLIVDDNDINKKLLAKVLENEKLNVTYASNGKEAVHLREEHDYDMIFMDIEMPIMNGVDASKAIRLFEEENAKSQVPIIALTANTGKDDRDKYLNAGMTDYMPKPIVMEDIRQKLASLH